LCSRFGFAGLIGISLLAVLAAGQTAPRAAAPAVAILEEAALPTYPPIAKAAHITGVVMVRVTVKAGSVVETEVTSKPTMASGGRFLEFATLNNLKTWRFAATVNDAFTVSFRYEMAGTETEEPTNDKVEVLPSLDVRITARPAKPTTNY
jgi:hypothetical protein